MSRALATPFISAVVGGGLVAGVLLGTGATGGRSSTTTIVRQAPLASSSLARRDGSLTARDIYKRDAPGVVFIRARIIQQTQSPFDYFPRAERAISTGSGFVIDHHGAILTNAHVVQGATDVRVSFSDERTVAARVMGKDEDTDLAVLSVPTAGLNLRPLPLGDSDTVQVGDPTVAIGNPFGLDRTLTTGVVSAKQRQIKAPNGFAIQNVLQTDAAINPGNSGGPLLDAAGQVIGINSQIATASGVDGSVGIGFAVPINTAKQVLPTIRGGGRVERAYLGVTGTPIDESLAPLKLPAKRGVLVQRVDVGTPAERAGIHGGDTSGVLNGLDILLGGDIITTVDGKPVTSVEDIQRVLGERKPGESVAVALLRDGKSLTVAVKLAKRPDTAAAQ